MANSFAVLEAFPLFKSKIFMEIIFPMSYLL